MASSTPRYAVYVNPLISTVRRIFCRVSVVPDSEVAACVYTYLIIFFFIFFCSQLIAVQEESGSAMPVDIFREYTFKYAYRLLFTRNFRARRAWPRVAASVEYENRVSNNRRKITTTKTKQNPPPPRDFIHKATTFNIRIFFLFTTSIFLFG